MPAGSRADLTPAPGASRADRATDDTAIGDPATADRATDDPATAGPAAPRVVWMPGRVRTEIHLGAGDTAGAFCLLVDHPPPGWSLPEHLHHGVAETIHIVEGEFEMVVGGRRIALGPSQTVHVPADVVHSGRNVGSAGGRRILIFSPAGMERFFLEAGAPAEDVDVTPADVAAVAVRHGWEFVAHAGPG